jgi:penicillin amidase
MRVIKWILSIFVVLIVVLLIVVYGWLRSTLPEYDGEMTVSGINGEVEIIRDSFGMPHIYASTDEDAAFALGYCMAQDRLLQMDLTRRAIRGELSEIMGESLVPVDKLFRTITAGKSVEDIMSRYPPETVSIVEAYAAGVNYFLENHDGPLPVEFAILGYEPEPWEASDGIATHYYMAWDLNSAFDTEMLNDSIIRKVGEDLGGELMSSYPEGFPNIIHGSETSSIERNVRFLETLNLARRVLNTEGGGVSNNWVISGSKSETGEPLLANDPHLGHGAPGIWYEAHISTPSMNVSGSVLSGIPFVIIGANDNVAWGFTNVMVDDADFYVEKINPDNPNQYEYIGRWEDMEVRDEVIKVKGADDVIIQVRITRHGPIIDEVNEYDESEGYAVSMRWTAYESLQALEAFSILNKAKDINDVERAVEYFKCPGQNWVYADDKGNIGFWAAAGIPIRDGFDGKLPVPGWDGRHEWKGYVPTNLQPHMRNPKEAWIATANNKHEGDDYPYVISHYYAMPDRFVRIEEMITEKGKLSISDFQRMHADFYVVLAEEWVPKMIEALTDMELSEMEEKALSELEGWDYVATPEGLAPTIFHATINKMVENTFKKRLDDELYELYIGNYYLAFNSLRDMISRGGSAWFDDPDTPEIEDFDDVIEKSFIDAVTYLDDEMGGDVEDWVWGDLHTLTLCHCFGKESALMGYFMNIGPFPMGGGLATVNPQPYRLTNPWDGYHGASLRYIFDLDDMKNSLRVIPAGISGNFMSQHYDDQTDMWRTVTYRPFVIDREGVEEDTRYLLKMIPE